jgi:uncharacterized protein
MAPSSPIVVGVHKVLMSAGTAIVLSFAAVACRSTSPSDRPTGTLSIRSAASVVSVEVEIADTDAARQKGLMGRTELGADAGMVFLFDAPSTGGFWMKDTLIPLDIAFWTRGGQITDILHMKPCRNDPCRLYVPTRPYVGALETNGGFFDQHDVHAGDTVRLDRAVS